MSSFNLTPLSASLCQIPWDIEGPPSYTEPFLSRYPECREKIENDPLLQKALPTACIEKNEARAYQALCAYYDKPVPIRERIVFDNGMTLSHFAALGGQKSRLEEEDLGDNQKSFLAHYLAKGGNLKLLQEIDQNKLLISDEMGFYPLDYAFLHKRKEIVEWFAKRGDFQVAYIMQDIFSSCYAGDVRFYTEVGIRILKLLNTSFCYSDFLKEVNNDVGGLVVIFDYIYLQFRWCFGALSNPEGTRLPELVQQTSFKENKEAVQAISSRAEIIRQKMCQAIDHINATQFMDEEADWDKRVLFVLGRMLEERRLSQVGYKIVTDQELLGQGTFARVYKVVQQILGKSYALKKYKKFMNPADERERLWYNYLAAADPKNEEHFVQKIDFGFSGERPALVLKLYDGDLRKLISVNQYNPYYIRRIPDIAVQILEPLAFLYSKRLVHADITPRNIFFEHPFRFVVGDFSLAYKEKALPEDLMPEESLQTSWYRSPECFLHAQELYGCEMDMWSVGCILFELFSAKVLFSCVGEISSRQEYVEIVSQHQRQVGTYPSQLLRAATEKRRRWHTELPLQINNPILKNVVKQVVPRQGYVESEKGLSDFSDLLEKMMRLNPKNRILPQQALKHPFLASLKEEGYEWI